MNKNFNDFRFSGLNYSDYSNQYFVIESRISENQDKIVIKVGDNHLHKTQYGYAFILDKTHVVFIKDWQVSFGYWGTEVILSKDYFNVKSWGNWDLFMENEAALNWEYWLNIAVAQNNDTFLDEEGREQNIRCLWRKASL